MRVMIGLSVATGLPWQYFERQDDVIIATYLDILRRARGKPGKGSSDGATAMARAPQMSG
jgi:hypothetical protein